MAAAKLQSLNDDVANVAGSIMEGAHFMESFNASMIDICFEDCSDSIYKSFLGEFNVENVGNLKVICIVDRDPDFLLRNEPCIYRLVDEGRNADQRLFGDDCLCNRAPSAVADVSSHLR